MCPQPDEGMEERTCEGLIATQGSRRVKHNNHTEATDVMQDGSRDIYLRCRRPGLTQNAGGRLLIVVDEVVNKTITDLCISYEEPAILLKNTLLTTASSMMPQGWEQQETQGEDLVSVAVLVVEDSDRRDHG